MAEKPIIEVQGLTKRFKGLTAVHDVSFSVEKGSITGMIGPNGAGKFQEGLQRQHERPLC